MYSSADLTYKYPLKSFFHFHISISCHYFQLIKEELRLLLSEHCACLYGSILYINISQKPYIANTPQLQQQRQLHRP
jgi:hypothetical protein